MARIEELIKNIADPALRDQVAAEVAALKANKKFGLVFEEHLPETVALPGLPIKPGVRAGGRQAAKRQFFNNAGRADFATGFKLCLPLLPDIRTIP